MNLNCINSVTSISLENVFSKNANIFCLLLGNLLNFPDNHFQVFLFQYQSVIMLSFFSFVVDCFLF